MTRKPTSDGNQLLDALPAVNPDWPAGWDDPASPFHIPNELRGMYQVDRDAELVALRNSGTPRIGVFGGPLGLVRDREAARRWKALHDASDNPDRNYPLNVDIAAKRREVDTFRDPLPETYAAADEAEWIHAWRLSQAATAARQLAAQEVAQHRWTAEHTCASCAEVGPTVTGRDVHGATLNVCRPCSILLAAAAVQLLSVQKLEDGRSRGEAARDYLQQLDPSRLTPPEFVDNGWNGAAPPLGQIMLQNGGGVPYPMTVPPTTRQAGTIPTR